MSMTDEPPWSTTRSAMTLPAVGSSGTSPCSPPMIVMAALTGHSLISLRVNEAAALPSPVVVLSARLDRYYDRLRRRSG
jgi:hypothetical protein